MLKRSTRKPSVLRPNRGKRQRQKFSVSALRPGKPYRATAQEWEILRPAVHDRARGHCEWENCQRATPLEIGECDHILSRAHGGSDVIENLRWLCRKCHRRRTGEVAWSKGRHSMSYKSAIEWTDATWTPIRARVRTDAREIATAKGYESLLPIVYPGKVGPHCEHVSPGCVNCYSETNNGRCLPHNGTGLPFDRRSRDLVETFIDEKILVQPLRWRGAKKIFVCSQTDLFGEWVTDEQIDSVFAVMALCPQHTFQVLTKRAERMRRYLNAPDICGRIAREANVFMRSDKAASNSDALHQLVTWARLDNAQPGEYVYYLAGIVGRCWPLPNVWLGVSVEDQQRANERIPLLLQTPAAVRFISAEPMLGPTNLRHIQHIKFGQSVDVNLDALQGVYGAAWRTDYPKHHQCESVDWVIVGGESGPGARPMNIAWAQRIVEQCQAAGVPVFVKQLGAHPIADSTVAGVPQHWNEVSDQVILDLQSTKGGDISEFPSALRVREFPAGAGVGEQEKP